MQARIREMAAKGELAELRGSAKKFDGDCKYAHLAASLQLGHEGLAAVGCPVTERFAASRSWKVIAVLSTSRRMYGTPIVIYRLP